MGRPMSKVSKVRVRGPLAEFAPLVTAEARQCGYTPLTTVSVLRLMANLSRWMEARGMGAEDLSRERAREFTAARRAAGRPSGRSLRSLAPVLAALDGAGVLAPGFAGRAGVGAGAVAGRVRGVPAVRAGAGGRDGERLCRPGAPFPGRARGGSLDGLTAADVTAAVLAEAETVSAGSAQYFVAALRAFLRFCYLDGHTAADLAWAAQAVTGRRRSALPKGISRAEARALLASCDRRRAVGRRDYAVLVLLLRLGLRAGEAAALRLEDIDWRAAEVTVHGKGSRDERLPLPGRRRRGDRRLPGPRPARQRAPAGLPARDGAGRAAEPRGDLGDRAPGVCAGGPAGDRRAPAAAHRRLPDGRGRRAATEIGQVLRHQSLESPPIYARVGVAELRTLARRLAGRR